MMYSPFGSISGGIHLVAKHPVITAIAVALALTLELGLLLSQSPAPPAPPTPPVPAIVYISTRVG